MRRSPKRSRDEKAKLCKLVDDFIREAGGTCTPTDWYPWCIDTPYGKLRLVTHPHVRPQDSAEYHKHESEDGYLNIMGRFDEPERVPFNRGCDPYSTIVDSNRFTGKWNYHGGNVAEGKHVTAEAIFRNWLQQLSRVLPLVHVAGRVGYTMFAVEPWGASARKLLDELFTDAAWSGHQMLVDHRYVDSVLDAVRSHGGLVI